jgi:glycosyltransferase involved in cell wall biosynthesis
MKTLRPGVTAVIPAILPRVQTYLHRAVDSVLQQDRPVEAISVRIDHERVGAARNRTHAASGANTKWLAFLDDDDEWNPDHIRLLMEHAEETGADMVYPWFTVPSAGGFDPWPEREGQPFDETLLRTMNYIPVTVLVKSELIWEVGGFTPKGPPENPCDDWGTWEKIVAAGGKISHLNRRTWLWHWHSGNTSGRSEGW